MQVVDKFEDEFTTVTFLRCEDSDASDHLHFEFHLKIALYEEHCEGVVYLEEGEDSESLSDKVMRIYTHSAKKLYCQAHGTNEITIH